jgi:NADPH-dependent 2,4-dienoyl-CoA reductase/sulfur reductase-like enzyme/rhodanese-related sulfurtransferase
MARRRVVVLGGAISGPTAAARARETDEDADVLLLERSAEVSYAACALAYHASGEVADLEALNRERGVFFWDVYRVRVQTGAAVAGIDPKARAVLVKGGSVPYDSLVYALGAESVVPSIRGLQGARNAFRFRTLPDLRGLLARADRGPRRVAVLGGGFIGVEAADGLARRGCKVTLIERGARILPAFSPAASRAAADALRERGVTVLEGTEVVRAARGGAEIRTLQVRPGRTLAVEAVVVAVGLRPRTRMLARAGGRLHADGSVLIDNRCATSLPGVFACGVCVSVPHAVNGRPVWLPQAALADKTAQVAGACAAGGDAVIGPAVGSAVVRAGELTLGRTGLTGEEVAAYAGTDWASARVHAPSREPLFPGSADTQLELFYQRRSGRLLGAEVVSRSGADKRVDVLAAAILGGLTVDQLAALDLAYAPPYSPARDPVNVAATVAAAARAGLSDGWSPAEVWARRRRVTVIDVRGDERLQPGTLASALEVPLHALRDRLAELDGRPLVFICDTGRLSYLATRIARQRGRQAAYLSGGLLTWAAEGRPFARGERA